MSGRTFFVFGRRAIALFGLVAMIILSIGSQIGFEYVISCGKVIVGAFPSGMFFNIDVHVSYFSPMLKFADAWPLDQVQHHFLGFGWQAPSLDVSRPCDFGFPWWFIIFVMVALNIFAWRNAFLTERKRGFPIQIEQDSRTKGEKK